MYNIINMDLYGSGASIAQANSQTQQAREINEATQDFNNSLAEQLDNAKTAENEEQTDITVKNMASVVTSGGKLIASAEARDDVVKAAQKLKGLPKAIVSRSPFKLGVESSEDLRPAIQTSADVAEGAAQRGAAILAGEGAEGLGPAVISRAAQSLASGELPSVGEGVSAVAKSVGFKSAEELGAAGFAKGAFAGIGGGIDVVKDIERGNFGSNSAQRIGNIGNIVGSALEVAGIVTSFTPFGLGLEGLGAAISLGSAALETGGDIAAGSEEAKTTAKDITSQARGDVAADVVTQAVGRTQ
jgi:hypothetical protein